MFAMLVTAGVARCAELTSKIMVKPPKIYSCALKPDVIKVTDENRVQTTASEGKMFVFLHNVRTEEERKGSMNGRICFWGEV